MNTNFNSSSEPTSDAAPQGTDSNQTFTDLPFAFPGEECQQADPFSPMSIIRTVDGDVILRCGHDPEHTSQVINA